MSIRRRTEKFAAGLQFKLQAHVDCMAYQWLSGLDLPAAFNPAGPIIESRIVSPQAAGIISFAGEDQAV
jgi:hypothetical protein